MFIDFTAASSVHVFVKACSDGPISRFRFCGENVGRSFVVSSHDQFSEITKNLQFGAKMIMQNLSVPFIFQGECRMKIEHVLYVHPFFSKLRIRLIEGYF